MKLLLLLVLCLPLAAQSRYLVAVWDNECKTLPRDTCWRYAFMPTGFTIERVPDHPWAYQMLAAPGTNPGMVFAARVQVTDLPCDITNRLQAKDNYLSICVVAPPEIAGTPRYVWVRMPYVVVQ